MHFISKTILLSETNQRERLWLACKCCGRIWCLSSSGEALCTQRRRLCQATARGVSGTCKSACIFLKVSKPFRNFTACLFITRYALDPYKELMKCVFPLDLSSLRASRSIWFLSYPFYHHRHSPSAWSFANTVCPRLRVTATSKIFLNVFGSPQYWLIDQERGCIFQVISIQALIMKCRARKRNTLF